MCKKCTLQKTVDIQTRMLANALNVEEKDVLRAVSLYTDSLTLLDQYDHQAIVKPTGDKILILTAILYCITI
ncbi:hypothetical protein SAMN02910429_00668 [Lachnobacterium bovis]|uniref:Uncharacterized protein n=1 Tax=Lachnobacterium bovis TaxID=140626 RepID=A0A1H9QWS5_9FIRM|nr:hypothetical protein SAMN02910429_00668 [Lachnobacterium bovis]